MIVVFVEGVDKIWSKGYELLNVKMTNVMMKDCKLIKKSPTEKEKAMFDVIDSKCIIWNKKYLVFVDAGNMKKLRTDYSDDLLYAVHPWVIFKKGKSARRWLLHIKGTRTNELVKELDDIIAFARSRTDAELPPSKKQKICKDVLAQLKKVQKKYGHGDEEIQEGFLRAGRNR